MNKSFLLISFSLICYAGNSQTAAQASEKNNNNQQIDHSIARTPTTQTGTVYFPVDDYNDIYMGHGDEYAHIFISQQIPSDFPKYTKDLTADDYKQLVGSYCKLNSHLIEEKFRSKYAK